MAVGRSRPYGFKHWGAVAVLLFVAAFPLMVWAAEPGEVVGNVLRVQGDAVAQRQGLSARSLMQGDALRFGEDIVTFTGARVAMRLNDGTEITLGETARLTIDAFVYDAAQGRAGATLRIPAGAFAVATGGIAKLRPEAMTFQTPVATIAIRGTDFWGGPIDDVYGVLLKTGRVEVRNVAGVVDLEPGQGTTLTSAESAPSPAVTWSEGRRAKAAASVAFH